MTVKDAPPEMSKWMEVMQGGQFTRDRGLRTRSEIERDCNRAEAIAKRRRELFPEFYRDSGNQ